jgi:hypothetical protein
MHQPFSEVNLDGSELVFFVWNAIVKNFELSPVFSSPYSVLEIRRGNNILQTEGEQLVPK